MGRYPYSEDHQNPDRNRPDHEGNQPATRQTIDFPPHRAAMGSGTVRRMVEGLVGLGVGFGCWANLEGLFLPRLPLRRAFGTPPPRRCATGRKMFRIIFAERDKIGGLRGVSGLWEDIHYQKNLETLTETDWIMKEINLPFD